MSFLLIFAFIVFAFFIFFEAFIAKEGKFKKTKILLLVSMSVSLIILAAGFLSATTYMSYSHEHYRRGIIKIGNMIESGHAEEAKKAIDHFKDEPIDYSIFSLNASLAIHRIIDEVIKETNSTKDNNTKTVKELKEDSSRKRMKEGK